MKTLILLISCLLILTPYSFGQSRGVWFWGSTTLPADTSSPWGSSEVIDTAALEEDATNFNKTPGRLNSEKFDAVHLAQPLRLQLQNSPVRSQLRSHRIHRHRKPRLLR
ncbi:MAG: hypothetical protein OSA93_15065 [Akkermansiaceae bacterium]|nr:hypothetical protein [Akkermansiaceae bacterium]